jgi:kumamolisin
MGALLRALIRAPEEKGTLLFTRSSRVIAAVLLSSFTLAACGGGGHSTIPSTSNLGPTTQDTLRTAAAVQPFISVPSTVGRLAFQDQGRRAATAPVSIAVTLAYNNQAQLDQFVADVNNPSSGSYHQYLTPAQFNSQYAPTAAQETAVVTALQNAGFKVTQRFANRTIVDAVAPSSTVEHFFNTEMHTVSQGAYGQRFANLKPATVPASIASYVRTASLSNVIVAETKIEQAQDAAEDAAVTPVTPQRKVPAAARARKPMAVGTLATNVVQDPGFESGGFTYWSQCGNVDAKISTANPHTGKYSELSGSTTSEPNGDAGVCQAVTVPASGVLSFWVWQETDETSTRTSYQEADLLDSNGNVLDNLYTSVGNGQAWKQLSYNIASYAGQTVYLYFGVHGAGSRSKYDEQYVDDVSLTSGAASPSPSPSPTAAPTATPTAKPTATPTAAPTATPTAAPTATPTVKPSTAPSTAPSTSPSTAPTGCNGAAADNGPLTNSSGTLATGVAKAFDFPVQHGCNGAGYTAAVIIDDAVNTSYVKSYLTAAGVTQTGTITNEAVDGGGTADDAETDLDVQTISGLAPGANIIVYDNGSLSDQAIEDAYNLALSDGKASVVNSSFGGCESSDTSFESATNTIAEQGAAEGVTFAASAGDSGSNECGSNDNAKGVSAPAGDPYFTSVGGLNFTETSAGVLETVTMGSESGDSGGGGVSTVVALPSFQSGITGVITTGRNQPDISLPFDPVAVYTGGAFGDYLGTSWSSPQFVALIITANELHASKLGWVNPTLYSLFKSTGYSTYFTPCTSGTNGAYSCSATEYNQAAGIGAPKGFALAQAL